MAPVSLVCESIKQSQADIKISGLVEALLYQGQHA